MPQVPADVLASLKTTRTATETTRAVRSLRDEDPVRQIVEAVAAGPSRAYCVAEINEQLGELAGTLDGAGTPARAAARIALFSAVAIAVVELSRSLVRGDVALFGSFAALATGLVGVFASAVLARRAARAAQERRAGYDRLSRGLERVLDERFGSAKDVGRV